MTSNPRGKRPVPSRATLMLRIFVLATSFLISSPTTSRAGTSHCGQVSELNAVQQRWAAARRSPVDPVHKETSCRAYGVNFYEAVLARQAVSICGNGSDHQLNLALLDSEIDAFNSLIATQCSSQ